MSKRAITKILVIKIGTSVLTNEKGFLDIDIIKNLEDLGGSKIDCVILVTEHDVFKDMDINKLKNIANEKPILIDVKGLFDSNNIKEAGFEYVRL